MSKRNRNKPESKPPIIVDGSSISAAHAIAAASDELLAAPAKPEPPLTIEVDGADSLVIAGESWVTAAEHHALLETVREQAAELKRLKEKTVGNPNGKPKVKVHLRCPACWTGLGGKASREISRHQINASKHKRYYACDQCGTSWGAEVETLEEDGIYFSTIKVTEARTTDVSA